MANPFKILSYLLVVGLFGAAIIISVISGSTSDQELNHFKKEIQGELDKTLSEIDNFVEEFKSELFSFDNFQQALVGVPKNDLLFQLYNSDSLYYWTDGHLPLLNRDEFEPNISFKNDQRIWYLVKKYTLNSEVIAFFIPLRNNFQSKNIFVRENYLFRNYESVNLEIAPHSGDVQIDLEGAGQLNLAFRNGVPKVKSTFLKHLSAWLFFFGSAFLVFMIGAYYSERSILKWPILSFFIVMLVLFALRFCLLFYKDYFGFSDLDFFNPSRFASNSNYLSSLGDLTLNFIFFLGMISFLFRNRRAYKKIVRVWIDRFGNRSISLVVIVVVSLITFASTLLINFLIIDSADIPQGFLLFYKFDTFSIISYALIVVLLLINIVFWHLLIKYLYQTKANIYLLLTHIVLGVMSILLLYLSYEIGLYILYTCVLGIIVYLFIWLRNRLFELELYLFLLVVFTLVFGFVFNRALTEKQIEYGKVIAKKLYAPEDRLGEYLLDEMIGQVSKDEFIKRPISSFYQSEDILKERIRVKYMDRYLDRYTITSFSKVPYHFVAGESVEPETKIRSSRTTLRTKGRLSYRITIPIKKAAGTVDTIKMELVQNSLLQESGLPFFASGLDLALNLPLDEFSSALYVGDALTSQSGNYPYTFLLPYNSFNTNYSEELSIHKENQLVHILYSPDAKHLQVVSLAIGGLFRLISICSMLLIFVLVIGVILWFVFNLVLGRRLKLLISYQNRIEVTLIGLVLIVLLVLGSITIFYTVYKYRQNLEDQASVNSQNVLASIQDELRKMNLNSISEEEDIFLKSIAKSNKVEMIFFNDEGKRVFTTANELLETNYLPKLINPDAFGAMKLLRRSFFLQEEELGGLKFLSVYLPIVTHNNKSFGILNIPFFTTEQELRSQTISFLSTLINLYVVVLLLATLALLWIGGFLTSPLRLMTSLIEDTKKGARPNVSIYDADDEIGSMLKEYTAMLSELDLKAEKLAESEKDAAWRQMARQIAHEVKNPLTPIRLSIQHLRRAWEDQSPEFEKMLKRITNTIMTQIDSLSRIATEFSDFAQIPVGKAEKTDLIVIVSEIVRLYKDQIYIALIDETFEDRAWIMADREQMSRVFNNLVKNASQANPNMENLRVDIRIYREDENYGVEVKDNGSGIDDSVRDRIFFPNFTTKNSGMGLGLAIVKKIIELSNGEISFETNLNSGTSFFVKLPAISSGEIVEN